MTLKPKTLRLSHKKIVLLSPKNDRSTMSVYELLCLSKESDQFEDFFSLHIMSNGMKISFERYCYLLALEKKHPSETHFHLVQDTSIHFDVSEQTIYNDITKMKFEVKGL